MPHLKALNLLLVMVAALWLPTGPCCAMASETLAGDADSNAPASTPPPAHCPAPSPCGSDTPATPANDAPPCHSPQAPQNQDGCECLAVPTLSCGREAPAPATLTSTTLPSTLISFPPAPTLADLYPPTSPAGRLAVDRGRPEPMGTPTLLGLGCMLTT